MARLKHLQPDSQPSQSTEMDSDSAPKTLGNSEIIVLVVVFTSLLGVTFLAFYCFTATRMRWIRNALKGMACNNFLGLDFVMLPDSICLLGKIILASATASRRDGQCEPWGLHRDMWRVKSF